jgi:hypothetical protein
MAGSPRAASFGPPPDRQPHPPVQDARADLRPARYRHVRGRVHGPGRASSSAIRLVSRRPPSRGRPDRDRFANPAIPSALNRLTQRRTVAGMAVQQVRYPGR